MYSCLALAGCARVPPGGRPDPDSPARQAAERAAKALATGEDASGAFASATSIAEIYSGMRGLRPQVNVGELLVGEDRKRAAASLAFSWTLRAGQLEWKYSVPLTLTSDDGHHWRASWTPQVVHLNLEPGDKLTNTSVPAQRGEIIGADDERLVYRHPVMRVGIDLTLIDRQKAAASARKLANELAIDTARYIRRVEDAGPRAFVEAQALRLTDVAHRDAIEAVKKIPGVRLINDERMLAIDPTFARPLLGIVGEATAEVIERSGGKVQEGDIVGLSGLQADRDEELRGVPGFVVERRPNGEVLTRADPVRGIPITVTLHRQRQEEAESLVARFTEPCGLVLLRIADGHVLAAASGRGGDGFSTATLAQVPVGVPPGGARTLAALGWDDPPTAGIPVTLGEMSGDGAIVSPLGVALVAASTASGKRVSPTLVVEGTPPARPPLGKASADAAKWVEQIGSNKEWWVGTSDAQGWVVVGYRKGADAATLAADWINQ